MNSKSFLSAFLMVALISGLILVSVAVGFVPVQASTDSSSIPKPPIPEFTVYLLDSSYDVPTTYSTDPYTGENVTHEGYHVESITMEVKIKNPSLAGWTVSYNVRCKGHFSEEWSSVYLIDEGYPTAESGEYTILSYKGTYSPTEGLEVKTSGFWPTFPPGAQVDFQVEAMIGSVHRDASTFWAPWIFDGEKSGWSETQTITISDSGSSSTPSAHTTRPTPTPVPTPIQVPGQSSFSVESNSTVSELFFNSTSSELSFTVNGTTGTAGYVKVTVAKSLVSNIQNVKTYMDGSELSVSITSDETSWFLSFNYLHSTHNVKINLATNAAIVTFIGLDFLVGLGVGIGIAIVGVCLLFYLKRRNR